MGLTIQIDSVAKPFRNDALIPANASAAVNFYQAHGLVRDRSKIVATDDKRTRILVNFRREYRTEPAACRNFFWYSRAFTRSHIEIECDSDLCLKIRGLLECYRMTETMAPTLLEAIELCMSDLNAKFVESTLGENVHAHSIGNDTNDVPCRDSEKEKFCVTRAGGDSALALTQNDVKQ